MPAGTAGSRPSALAILLVVVVALVVYVVLQPTPLSGGELEVLQKLEHLRETIPGGFI